MRILAAADFHGKEHRYEAFRAGVTADTPDIAVLAGDVNDSQSFFSLLSSLDIPALIIHGNMDSVGIADRITGIDNAVFLHNRATEYNGVSFVGIGGGSPEGGMVTPVNGGDTRPIDEVSCDVLVSHVPPRGVKDAAMLGRRIGSPWIRSFIVERQPRVVLCGHVHEDRGHAWLNDTMVVNCTIGKGGAYSVVDISGEISVRHE